MEKTEVQELKERLSGYLEHPLVRSMDNYCAHGKETVLSHSLNVVKTAYVLNQKLGLKADLDTLLTGALLHDFYLYDWHDAPLNVQLFKMHGYTHPEQACRNAVTYFDVDDRIQEVIRCHMWPLTLRSLPRHKEAILVCLADKICAIKETLIR